MVHVCEVRPLRREVLLPESAGQGPPWPGDEDSRTLHLVIKDGKRTLAAVSLVHEPRAELGSEVWRIRGPLVVDGRRREGLGSQLAKAVQAVVEKRGGGLWARLPLVALPFFSALGFKSLPDDGAGDDDLLMCWRPKP